MNRRILEGLNSEFNKKLIWEKYGLSKLNQLKVFKELLEQSDNNKLLLYHPRSNKYIN